MTPPTSPRYPAGAHPSADDLADLAEGLTESPAEAGALRDHLADCPDCRDTLAALTEIQELLGSVETPPMPADVARRLDAALAAEAATPRTPTAPDGPVPHGAAPRRTAPTSPPTPRPTPRPGGTGRSRTRLRRRVVLLGGVLALTAVAIGAVLVGPLGPGQRSDSTAASAAAVTGPAALGPLPTTGPTGAADAPAVRLPAAAAGTDYRADTLPTQIRHLLSARSDAARPRDGEDSTAGATASCAPAAPAAPAALLTTDHGTFEGRPVDVLVYAIPGSPELVDVYLVDPGCAAGPDPVRLHRTVPLR